MRLVLVSMSLGVLALLAGGCQKNGSAEQAGEEIKEAGKEASDAIKGD